MTKNRDEPTKLEISEGLIFVDPMLIPAFKSWAERESLPVEFLTSDRDFEELKGMLYVTKLVGYARKAKIRLQLAFIPSDWMENVNPFGKILKTSVNGRLIPNVVRIPRSLRTQYVTNLSTLSSGPNQRSLTARAKVSANGDSFTLLSEDLKVRE